MNYFLEYLLVRRKRKTTKRSHENNGVLAQNGQSLKHTLDCTETEVNS